MDAKLPSIPEAVSDLATLRILARRAVEGTLSGLHRSGLFGSSLVFAEHKPYAAGDDLKHVDWKVFGRADKYYLKQFEDETNLRAYIVVDRSASMDFGTIGYKKSDYAMVLAATFAYLFIQQQDLVGLLQFGDTDPHYVPPRGRMPHFRVLTELLQTGRACGKRKVPEALAFLRERIHRKAAVIVLSDFLCSPEDITPMAKMFGGQGQDMIWLHLLDPAEINFPFRGRTAFRGLEGEAQLETNAAAVGHAYRQEVANWVTSIRNTVLESDNLYRLVTTDEAINHVLAAVLS